MKQREVILDEEVPPVASPNPETAKLTVAGKTLELPVIVGSEGEKAVDISRLRDETQAVMLDLGFGNTASCTSAITFLDGEKGVLRYRGFPIEDLAEYATNSEVAYLLIYGNLPNHRELEQFTTRILERASLPEGMERFFDHLLKGTHPMAALSASITALSGHYPQLLNPSPTREEMDAVILTLLAQVPTLAAYGYRKRQGLPVAPPRRDLSPVANFLSMLFGATGPDGQPDEVVVRALRQILILHADHEQNCSTSTVRLVGSSRANAFVAIASGMNALWGPLHGGANQAVIEMLEAIHRDGGNFTKYIAMAKDKTSGFRLMGLVTGSIKTSIPDPKSSRVPATRCWLGSGLPILYWTWPSAWKRRR